MIYKCSLWLELSWRECYCLFMNKAKLWTLTMIGHLAHTCVLFVGHVTQNTEHDKTCQKTGGTINGCGDECIPTINENNTNWFLRILCCGEWNVLIGPVVVVIWHPKLGVRLLLTEHITNTKMGDSKFNRSERLFSFQRTHTQTPKFRHQID